MFFCKNCGAKIDNDNAKFCPNCGQKFEPKQNEQTVKSINNNRSAAGNSNKAAHISQPPIADEIKKSDDSNNINSNNINNNNNINSSPNSAPAGNILHPAKIQKQQIKNNNSNKQGKRLLAVLIVLVIVLGTAGTLVYFYTTGKLNQYKEDVYNILHIKKNQSESNHKSSHKKHQTAKNSSKTKLKKDLKKSAKSKSSVAPAPSAAPQTAAQSSAPTYVYSNNVAIKHLHSNSGNGLTLFKASLASARASITGISPLNNSGVGDAPAVIISDVLSNGANAAQGKTIILHSKFYAETPAVFSSQSVKLTYEIYGNGFTAYNNSYINVTKPGIYSVALSISVPADFPTGIYNYTLTVTSAATIEESAAANLKIQQ
jgi:hypothetical protein